MIVYVAEWCEQDGGGFSHANLTLEGAQKRTVELEPTLEGCSWYELGPWDDTYWDSECDAFDGFYRIRAVEVGR